jgi:hypothetical protein
MRSFWRSYWTSGDRALGMVEFSRLVRMGHIVCIWLLEVDKGGELCVSAQFGVELMQDLQGPYTQFIFFDRDTSDKERGNLSKVLPCVVATCFKLSELYADSADFQGEQRLFIGGRKGWRRMVRSLGIEMNGGWITNRQRCFDHGSVRWH